VYFVRHGESVANVLERSEKPGEKGDDRLSDTGWEQARALGKRLAKERLTHILVSPLRRAQETADAINETLRLPTETLDFIYERIEQTGMNHGPLDQRIFPATWMAEHAEDPDFALEGAESFNQVLARVDRLLTYLQEYSRGKDVLVVSHGEFIRFILGRVIFEDVFDAKLGYALWRRIASRNTGITIFEYVEKPWPGRGEGFWRLNTWMDHAHL
jgi:broad specificity phosphatase PhoE